MQPMSRSMMQNLPMDTAISRFITTIYNGATHTASEGKYTMYKDKFNSYFTPHISTSLGKLQALFPECDVKHAILALGTDGVYYDIAELTDNQLPLVHVAEDSSYIVIDWT